MTRSRRYSMLLIAGLCMAATASAQSLAPDTARTAPATATSDTASNGSTGGPRLATLSTGIHRQSVVDEGAETQRRQPQSVGKLVALMVVGGAAIVLGAVIGDDGGTVFMVGGAGTLLYGLYEYLK